MPGSIAQEGAAAGAGPLLATAAASFDFAPRAGRQMALLVQEGEDHGSRQKANQIDRHRRFLEWFGRYTEGEMAPAWIADGVRMETLERETRRIAEKDAPTAKSAANGTGTPP